MNRVSLIGRLTRDPDTRATSSNILCSQFTLAVNRDYKNQDGVYDADFINCQAWRSTAEAVDKYLRKGQQVGIDGKLQTRSWDATDGSKRYATEVVVEKITFIGNNQTSNVPQATGNDIVKNDAVTTDPYAEFGNEVALTDDDLPF